MADTMRQQRAVFMNETVDPVVRAQAVATSKAAQEVLRDAFTIDPSALGMVGASTGARLAGGSPLADAMLGPTDQLTMEFQDRIRAFTFDAEDIINQATNVIGDALFDGFAAAFSGEGFSGLLNNFGATMLSGLGSIFSDMGKQLLQFGAIMKKLQGFLLNPITSGPAAIAAGVALVALGGALSGVAQRTGTRGQGSPMAQALQGGSFGRQDMGETTVIVQGGLLDMSDPRQRDSFAKALGQISGRRVTIQGA